MLKNTLKRYVLAPALVASFAFTPVAFSQTQVDGTIATVQSGSAIGFNQDGTYDFNQVSQDNTRVIQDILNRKEDLNQQDRAFLESVVDRMNTQLADILVIRDEIRKMSQDSLAKEVSLDDFLAVSNKLRTALDTLDRELDLNTVITADSLPSATEISVGDQDITSPTVGNIDFGPLVERVNGQKSSILSDLDNYSVKVITEMLDSREFSGAQAFLNPDLACLQIIGPDRLEELNLQIEENNQLTRKTKDLLQGLVDSLPSLIQNFVTEYGTSEWLRFTNENDAMAAREEFMKIQELFFVRSYMRARYQIPIGAFQPGPSFDANKWILNLEDLTHQPLVQALKSENWSRTLAVTDLELVQAFAKVRHFVEMYDKKTIDAFASRDDLDAREEANNYTAKDVGFVTRINAAFTWATDQRATTEVLLGILKLMLNDIREEMMLTSFDNTAQQNFHEQNYFATPAMADNSARIICKVDSDRFNNQKPVRVNVGGVERPMTEGQRDFLATCGNLTDANGNRIYSNFDQIPALPRGQRGRNLVAVVGQIFQQMKTTEAARYRIVENAQSLMNGYEASRYTCEAGDNAPVLNLDGTPVDGGNDGDFGSFFN